MQDQELSSLWKEYYPRIVFYIRHSFPSLRTEAEDLCQEVFVRAYANAGSLADGVSARPWLYTVARNLCIDRLRKGVDGDSHLPDDGVENIEDVRIDMAEQLERKNAKDSVAIGIAKLKPKDREICYLYYFEEMRTTEIARVVHRPSGTVKYRLFRIRATLKRHLEAMHET
jgi:RNA polymerase sigma-70 factor (ECF subfamily)